jgi:hypothetical protein
METAKYGQTFYREEADHYVPGSTKYGQTFYREEADHYVPGGCSCTEDSGTCGWCYIYYGYYDPSEVEQ